MTDRITVQGLYKIFGKQPDQAIRLLADGRSKEKVLAETDHVVALNDVTLSVPEGSIYMVMGLSGSGKSTLARCINRLIEPSAGRILLDGEDITRASEARLRDLRRTRISMVFQHFALLPNKTVIENAEFGLKLRGVSPRERRRKAEEVLTVVGLASWANYYPDALSGGMRQRVGLARALATDADVLIMDEAFSALDPLIRTEMQDELLRLQRVLRKTILFITHDFQEALRLGTRIAIMSDGALVREGTPQDIVTSPDNDYVAAFTKGVDRARVYDAASIMTATAPVVIGADGLVSFGRLPEGEQAFAIDPNGRILGVLSPEDRRDLRQGMRLSAAPSRNFVAVKGKDKLCDVASACRAGAAMAVLDDDGRLAGSIDPVQILARIGTPAAPPAQKHS
ncbi:MAG: quaternary amine ABC transporter ATP-binding protein [Pseudomonadota bacterium]